MKKRDLNEIAKIEKAIKDKYGLEAIQNPRKYWDDDKEKKYLKELKAFHLKKQDSEIIEHLDDLKIKKKKLSKSSERICPVCGTYSIDQRDDLYMTKFECCFNCYIQYIEDREERWKSGWRPND